MPSRSKSMADPCGSANPAFAGPYSGTQSWLEDRRFAPPLYAPQFGSRPVSLPDPDRSHHRSRTSRRAPVGDAAQRDSVHDCPGIHPGQPRDDHRRVRAAEPVRRRRIRERRSACRHRISRPHTLVLPHGRHDGRCHESRSVRSGFGMLPASDAELNGITCRYSSGWRP